MAFFPVFMDVNNKKCVIVGGGSVAFRKMKTLSAYEMQIDIIAEMFGKDFQPYLDGKKYEENMHLFQKRFETKDMKGAFMVIAATNDRKLNQEIASICQSENILVNVATDGAEGNFLFPAVVKSGEISIGINTGGKSPLLSGRIRQRIEDIVPSYYPELNQQLCEIRNDDSFKNVDARIKRKCLNQIVDLTEKYQRVLTTKELYEVIKSYTE